MELLDCLFFLSKASTFTADGTTVSSEGLECPSEPAQDITSHTEGSRGEKEHIHTNKHSERKRHVLYRTRHKPYSIFNLNNV